MKRMESRLNLTRNFGAFLVLAALVSGTSAQARNRHPAPSPTSVDSFGETYADTATNSSVAPDCVGPKGTLPVDNAAVLALKTSTPNQFLARAHVAGTIGQVYPDENGHNHFELLIGSGPKDTIEIIYNISFGQLPKLVTGMTVEACGDFINSDAPTAQYPASPDDAILHWVHRNPRPSGHASGFVTVNGQLFGQGHG